MDATEHCTICYTNRVMNDTSWKTLLGALLRGTDAERHRAHVVMTITLGNGGHDHHIRQRVHAEHVATCRLAKNFLQAQSVQSSTVSHCVTAHEQAMNKAHTQLVHQVLGASLLAQSCPGSGAALGHMHLMLALPPQHPCRRCMLLGGQK
ncbi:hypothetical protein DUNSADRAFT_8974 [Dunaliella salina]|uniref:Encoded protein n=1 Tax=Dunaliella salina TaxID=3046 RepID=A0ABQ7GIG8_DUNSA|nr:hypothetical protein DUNSADRAFT_8974 [Dunaliella salina]|eukprot:KAF5834388.1 hypothetical protein DUNSADRAFT_8974 [Dunaliella salina]